MDPPPAQPPLRLFEQITKKLKKRGVLQKANFPEAIQSYEELLRLLNCSKEDKYCGLICVALAKCHRQNKDNLAEAHYYHLAGKRFFSAQKTLTCSGEPSYEECAELGLECYLASISVYKEQKKGTVIATLYHELATTLACLGRTIDASEYFEKSADLLQTSCIFQAIHSFKSSLQCHLLNRKYSNAIQTIQSIETLIDKQTAHNNHLLANIRIENSLTNVLLLILKGDFDHARFTTKKNFGNAQIIDYQHPQKHAPFATNSPHSEKIDHHHPPPWFASLLEALIHSVETNSQLDTIKIHSELQNTLTPLQNQIIVDHILHSSSAPPLPSPSPQ